MTTKIFLRHLLLLMVGFSSCKTYQNIENIKMPKNEIVRSDTFPPSYFAHIIPGDKIQVIDKYGQVNELIFSGSDETNVYGQIYIDPVQFRKVEPYDFTIPIANIKNVRGVNVPSKKPDKIDKVKGPTEDDFKKISAGEQILIEKKNGQPHYMYFKEFRNGVVYGDTWGSNKNDRKMPTKEIEILLSEIEEITVKRFSAKRTGLLMIGVGGSLLAILIIGYIANPFYIN